MNETIDELRHQIVDCFMVGDLNGWAQATQKLKALINSGVYYTCQECGKIFQSKRKRKRVVMFCSKECDGKAYHKRRKSNATP